MDPHGLQLPRKFHDGRLVRVQCLSVVVEQQRARENQFVPGPRWWLNLNDIKTEALQHRGDDGVVWNGMRSEGLLTR